MVHERTFQRMLKIDETSVINNRKARKSIIYITRLRFQRGIDVHLRRLLTLAQERPELFLYEGNKNEYGHFNKNKNPKYMNPSERFRMLLEIILALKPNMDIELVLKNMNTESK